MGTPLLVGVTTAPAVPAGEDTEPLPFMLMWGEYGTGPGQFSVADDLALSPAGLVYVTDHGNNRVQVFTAGGASLGEWNTPSPGGIGVDQSNGNVYVADSENGVIRKYNGSGQLLTSWGSAGSGPGQFEEPHGIAVDPTTRTVFVADKLNDRVQRFDGRGTYLGSWGGAGSGPGEFSSPYGVAVDPISGKVFVTDSGHDRVQKFTMDGSYRGEWTTGATPRGISVDGAHHLTVTDFSGNRVEQFTAGGAPLTSWGTTGSGANEFHGPTGVAVRTYGEPGEAELVYVVDTYNNRIKAYGLTRPDARIRVGPSGAYVGDGVYNTTGAGQNVTASAPRGTTVTYMASIENDGITTDSFSLRATPSDQAFRIAYRHQGVDVTDEVIAGSYGTGAMDSGSAFHIKVEVTVRATAPAGARVRAVLNAKSSDFPQRKDTVAFTTARS